MATFKKTLNDWAQVGFVMMMLGGMLFLYITSAAVADKLFHPEQESVQSQIIDER